MEAMALPYLITGLITVSRMLSAINIKDSSPRTDQYCTSLSQFIIYTHPWDGLADVDVPRDSKQNC